MNNFFDGVGQYWADDNAEFERSNPTGLQRAWRGVNPLTGFGSALGSMHSAAGQGDLGGMAEAGIQAIPGVGALRPIMPFAKGAASKLRSQGGGRGPYSGANPPPGYKPAADRVPSGPLPGATTRQPDPNMVRNAEIAQGVGMALQAPQTAARWAEAAGTYGDDAVGVEQAQQYRMPEAPELTPEQMRMQRYMQSPLRR